jgi:hypothetical protein
MNKEIYTYTNEFLELEHMDGTGKHLLKQRW